MKPLGLNEIREKYLAFFETKDHLRLKSFPLVPINDKSLLLINSGMAPMKAYFTGDEVPPRERVTTCQKCIRTPDIDNVGKTARHGTFFEMLGNFSFGDYFKKEVIPWAWEFSVDVMEMDPEKIHVTVYLDDDEAYGLWKDGVGVNPSHIHRLGKKDNFWEHGIGPCGPCSEIFYDRGKEYGCDDPDCAPGCDCDRFVEYWNLVFTQFDRDEAGEYTPLANPNIDTGMGLERLATVMQGVNTIFEVDTIGHVLNVICKLANVTYGADYNNDVSIRVITDHVRSFTFMIADGVMPSNEGRGYVLRRLLRRAARHGKLLGIQDTFLHDLVKEVVLVSGDAYPELKEKSDYIQKLVKIEEDRFTETIDQGLNLLNEQIDALKVEGKTIFPGEAAFKLYDTYGFPWDLTKEIVEEKGLEVNVEDFQKSMEEQRQRARKAREAKDTSVWADDPFNPLGAEAVDTFVGYDNLTSEGEILGLIKDGGLVDKVEAGDDVLVLLNNTSFYSESGGQVGDIGEIRFGDSVITITDTKKGSLARHIHHGKVVAGQFEVGQMITTQVDKKARFATQRNHTATHLLQRALKEVLGDHVEQAGSFVSPDRLRFDFNHFQAMTQEEKIKVENIVNEAILEAYDVTIFHSKIDEARAMGAMALFGEKYGEIVRVVKVEDFSVELCGGCHVTNSAQVGSLKILSESGVAAGIRRIEATTGMNAVWYMEKMDATLHEVAAVAKTTPDALLEKVQELTESNRKKDKEIAELKQKSAGNLAEEIYAQRMDIAGVAVVISEVMDMDMDGMRSLSDKLKDKLGSGIVLLGTKGDGKVSFLAAGTKDVVKQGFHAGNLVKGVAAIAGGGGGGRPDMAQAGGKKPEKLGEALAQAKEILGDQLK